jgi:hypothetical protein
MEHNILHFKKKTLTFLEKNFVIFYDLSYKNSYNTTQLLIIYLLSYGQIISTTLDAYRYYGKINEKYNYFNIIALICNPIILI